MTKINHHDLENLPVAVIGAGAVGLAAAAHLVQRGETPLVFEMGSQIASNVRKWAHVRLFSPWEYTKDAASVILLEKNGWVAPHDTELPTGDDLITKYLEPLAATPELKPHIHFNGRVVGISRYRIDKLMDDKRDETPFLLQVEENGVPQRYLAKAVIDASGVYATPNPVGSAGLPAVGETANKNKIFYGIPDIKGTHLERYAGKIVTVVGGGHSAINALLDLGDIQENHPTTHLTWILRKQQVSDTYGGKENDALPERGLLGKRMEAMVEAGKLQVYTPFYTTQIEAEGEGIILIGDTPDGEKRLYADEVIAATGARPDLSFLREIRLGLDASVESTPMLAPLIDPNLHSCGTVPPHGEADLRHPEPNFYIVGNKSYGRAPTFLLMTGYEQVRSVVAAIVGDWVAAQEVRLILPETGVCNVTLPNGNGSNSACCTPVAVKMFN
jgi:thioredoxin reductase